MFFDMKKTRFFKRGFTLAIAGIMMLFAMVSSKPYKVEAATTSVSQLKVSRSQLCDANGNAIQLKGMSSHGLQWSVGNYMNYDSMKFLRDNWGVNVVRAAMYTGENGYISNPTTTKARVKEIVQAAIDLKMYVVIDWHILSDNNPNTYKEQAKSFFQEMAKTYGNTPNVIYEICNEPNGVNWSNDIKPYADYIIPAIRAIDPDNIIIVGTSNWSQDVDVAASNPLSYSNIMYACHFYAGSHGQELRDKINTAMSKGSAVFVSEWGTSDASGDGGPYLDKSQQWIDFMNSKKISWINWSLSNTTQSSSALKSNASTNGGWSDSDLTTSGLFVKKNISGVSSTTPVTDTPVQEPTGKIVSNVAVTSAITTDWGTGATVQLTIKNNNSTPINGWTLSWALPNNQSITAMWNGTYTQNKSNINVTSDSSHSYIAANGGTQTLVYNINYSGSNTQPRNFTLRTANSASNVSAQDITYEVSPDWGSGATIHLTIKNNSSTPINGWKLSWTLPNNQSITDMWNGTYTKSGSTINVTSDNYHNYIAANGGTQTLVYNINYIGSNTKPTNFMLNGTPCLVK